MTTVSIDFRNSNEQPVYLQVDPWAGVYLLKMGEEIRIVAESQSASASFSIEECGSTRILLIADSTEYYVVVNGQRVHWKEYQSTLRL